MRLVLLLLLVVLVVTVLVPLLRRPVVRARRAPSALADELVKDPVCQTYVVRSRALSRPGPGGPRYFCSDACARRGT